MLHSIYRIGAKCSCDWLRLFVSLHDFPEASNNTGAAPVNRPAVLKTSDQWSSNSAESYSIHFSWGCASIRNQPCAKLQLEENSRGAVAKNLSCCCSQKLRIAETRSSNFSLAFILSSILLPFRLCRPGRPHLVACPFDSAGEEGRTSCHVPWSLLPSTAAPLAKPLVLLKICVISLSIYLSHTYNKFMGPY
jgi:hypothetical protein